MNVIDWLLDSDPAIRWQVMRDLTDAPAEDVAAERAKVAREGWGAAVLAAQRADGSWAGGAYAPEWTSTTSSLQLLRAFGVDPTEESVRRALALVRANVKWEYDDLPYFDGEVEPCINGQAVAIGAYFGQDVRVIVDRLLTEQMADGGWNCEQEPERGGSTRGSFDTTINVLEGLLEYERADWTETRTSPLPASADRSTCSSADSCAGCPMARSAIASGFTSRFRPGGTTAPCARSTTSAMPASRRTSESPRRSSSSSRSATPTAGGRSPSSCTTSCPSTSASARGSRAAGSRCVRFASSAGPVDRSRL